ncbi:MAG: hypothetical protein E6J90_12365 [Deltaproteobacteria bacterium]|nr:MAG: hypothetical protein E6J90_12365 [Deltaproteobacteria bacterium]
MYAGVPIAVPGKVNAPSSALDGRRTSPGSGAGPSPVARASPKSVTTTRPRRSISTLGGLKSRWTIPAAWAAARPRPAATIAAMIASRGWPRDSHAAMVSPSISSIAITSRSPTVIASKIVITFG